MPNIGKLDSRNYSGTILSRHYIFCVYSVCDRCARHYLKTLWFTIYWTPFFLLLIVIVEQSVHIKYTKSTQRQKRLVSSRKIFYKIFAFSLSLSLISFYFSLIKFSPSRRAILSLIFGTENAIIDPSLRWRERDTRAITIYLFFPSFSFTSRVLQSLYLSFFFNIVLILCRLKKAPNRRLVAR